MSVTEPIPTTLQGIFDRVSVHLLRQGKRSHSGIICLYRGDDGCMCAIGCLIPDAVYDTAMEDRCADHLIKEFGFHELAPFSGDLTLLQKFHDNIIPSFWGLELRKFAADRSLSTAAMDAVS